MPKLSLAILWPLWEPKIEINKIAIEEAQDLWDQEAEAHKLGHREQIERPEEKLRRFLPGYDLKRSIL